MSPRQLIRSLAAGYRLRQRAREIGSLAWARRLAEHGLPGFPARAQPDGRLALPDLGLEINAEQQFVLGAYGYLWDIKACGFSLEPAESGEIELAGHGVRARLNSHEELFIFREIFCGRTYDVQPADGALVIDIGMNIGLASLFFASVLTGCRVEAFEPFPATFARARYQLSLNPALTARIHAWNFGLWTTNEHRRVEIDASHKGSTGIWGVQADLKSAAAGPRVGQEIALRCASDVLGPILAEPLHGPVILKLDAEGSEYGIFEKLAEAGLADRFDVILMEWHRNQADHDPQRLRDLLARFGYRSLCQEYLHRPFGMLYAFRRSTP